jgi:hypothetical protein
MNHPDPRDSGENLFDEADEDEVRRELKKPEEQSPPPAPPAAVMYSRADEVEIGQELNKPKEQPPPPAQRYSAEEEQIKEEIDKKSEKRRWAIFLRKRKN